VDLFVLLPFLPLFPNINTIELLQTLPSTSFNHRSPPHALNHVSADLYLDSPRETSYQRPARELSKQQLIGVFQ
jgi:hypothetical protein